MYDKISEWLSLHPLFSGGFISFLLAVLRLFRERHSFPYVKLVLQGLIPTRKEKSADKELTDVAKHTSDSEGD